jgi:hypothetical protein
MRPEPPLRQRRPQKLRPPKSSLRQRTMDDARTHRAGVCIGGEVIQQASHSVNGFRR